MVTHMVFYLGTFFLIWVTIFIMWSNISENYKDISYKIIFHISEQISTFWFVRKHISTTPDGNRYVNLFVTLFCNTSMGAYWYCIDVAGEKINILLYFLQFLFSILIYVFYFNLYTTINQSIDWHQTQLFTHLVDSKWH